MKTIGLLVGRERSFPDALIAEVAARDAGVAASYAELDITRVNAPPAYDVLVDRISHDVPCYQPMLKLAVLNGTRVVNNPFWRIADDKAFGTALAQRLGVPVPKTAVLPQKSYGPDLIGASLGNLRFPLDWEGLERDLGFPMFVKPHWGGGFKDVHQVKDHDELLAVYDRSGTSVMIAQEAIGWTQYVRCVVIGKTEILTLPWDPTLSHFARYRHAASSMPPLSEGLVETIEIHAKKLCDALGYDMNTVEFAVRDGVPYAIDFMNSAPDFDISSLGETSFRWVVDKMADLLIRLAHDPRVTPMRWDAFLGI